MKLLQKFVEEYTNVDIFLDESRSMEEDVSSMEIDIFNDYLIPNGVPRRYLETYIFNPHLKRPEDVVISLEENLIHPEIAIWVTKQKMVEVFESLHNIQMEILNQLETTMVM